MIKRKVLVIDNGRTSVTAAIVRLLAARECATEGCRHEGTEYFQSGGVGSTYCKDCYDSVRRIDRP